MKLWTSTPDRIAEAFADAVASGEHEAAEGWLAVAAYAERRRAARRADGGRSVAQARRSRQQREPAA